MITAQVRIDLIFGAKHYISTIHRMTSSEIEGETCSEMQYIQRLNHIQEHVIVYIDHTMSTEERYMNTWCLSTQPHTLSGYPFQTSLVTQLQQ